MVTVDAGGTWTNNTYLGVGEHGQGTLLIQNGGQVSVGTSLSVGEFHGGVGLITVTGYGSQLTVGTFTDIGQGVEDSGNPTTGIAQGTLQVLQGAQAIFNGSVGLGTYLQSQGTVLVNGTDGAGHASTLTVVDNSLLIGRGNVNVATTTGTGNGSLTVSNGGQVLVTYIANPVGGQIFVGEAAGGAGQVTVTDPGSILAAAGEMTIGSYGSGTLQVQNGGTVTSANGYIARLPGSTGIVLITGPNSSWTVQGGLYIGGNETASSGTPVNLAAGLPSLTIADGATVTVSGGDADGLLQIWGQATVTLADSSASLTATTVNVAGTLQGAGTVNGNVTNTGSIEPSGGTLTFTGSLANPGTIQVPTGAKLLAQNFPTNAGMVTLAGGTFDNDGQPLNNTGQITGYGVLTTGGLTNNNVFNLAGGASTVNGPVINALNETINVGASAATFTGNVTNNGTIKATSTTVTFAGTYTGNVYISDPATNIFQKNVTITPGGSMTGGTGDVFSFTGGTVTNNGTFANTGTLSSSVNISNAGTFTQSGPQTWSLGTTFTSTAGSATFSSDPGSTAARDLSLAINSGTVTLNGPQHLNTLSITGGTLNVDGDVFLASGSYASLGPLLQSHAITTTSPIPDTGVALESGADFLALNPGGQRDGQTVLATDQLLSLTYFGDINLDGTVDLQDYRLMDASYLQGYDGTTKVAQWINGDFNYDGIVNYEDYALADAALQMKATLSWQTG